MSAKINDGLTRGQRWYRKNLEAQRAKARAWYYANPDKVRAKMKTYRARKTVLQRQAAGLPPPTRPEPDGCEKCGKTRQERHRKQALCVDHCHKTGKFRGWLCTMCNIGIGNLGDDLEGVEQALAYLRRAM